MEKNTPLDPCLKALCLTLLVLAASCCVMPRIAILRDPLTPEEHINLGVSYERRGELDAALKEYETASGKSPLAFLYLGNVYFQKRAFSDAEHAYRKAIERKGSPEAYNNLAWLYYTENEHMGDAEQLAAKAVELSPGSDSFADTLRKVRERRQQ